MSGSKRGKHVRRAVCLGVAVCVWSLLGACDDRSEEDRAKAARIKAKQRQSAQAKRDRNEPPNEKYGERHRAAVDLLDSVVAAAAEHFKNKGSPERATFPGGVDVEFRSVSKPPQEGKTYEFGSSAVQDSDTGPASAATGDPEAEGASVSKIFGIGAGQTLPAQLVYRTGGGRGAEATAVVKAVLDFDPDAEDDHTIFQELSVDAETGKVNVFPRIVHHRWK